MRTTMILAALAAAGLLTLAGGASGSGGGVVASAGGAWTMSGQAAGSTFEIDPFSFHVQIHADGRVKGVFDYRQVRDGVELTVSGSLDCATIRGNQAWVGGVIEESSRANLIGLDMWFQVQDHGKLPAVADMSSTIGAGGPGTGEQYCVDAPTVLFPFFLKSGNLRVHSSR